MLACRDLVAFLDVYLAGELPEPARSRFEEHLSRCPPCAAYMKSYATTIQLARATGEDPEDLPSPPEEVVRGILATAP